MAVYTFSFEIAAFVLALFGILYSLTVRRRQYHPPKGLMAKLQSQHFMFLLMLLSIPSVIANRRIPNANYMYLGNYAEGSTGFVDPLSFLSHSQALRYLSMFALAVVLFHLLYAVERRIERHIRNEVKT